MKIAVSIPDPIFRSADAEAHRCRMSRSQLYARALSEYLEQHGADAITSALDAVYADEDSKLDPELMAMQMSALPPEPW